MNKANIKANFELVGRALNFDLRDFLAPFVAQALSKYFRADWWQNGVLKELPVDQRRSLPREGNYSSFTDRMDVQLCLQLIGIHWRDIFRLKMTENQRSWVSELRVIRNDWAHSDFEKFDDSYVERALDTMARLCQPFDNETSINLWNQLKSFRLKRYALPEELEIDEDTFFQRTSDLPSWRSIMQPNPDVQDGTYRKAEFAANLGQVAAGTSTLIEYQDATEFFARTYMTIGMKRLLTEAINRLLRGTGEPMIEVKTSFGGGKTHSMMALYHLFNRKYRLNEVDESVQNLFRETKLTEVPKDVRIAVAVGTDLNPERAKEIPEIEGAAIHTFMGEVCSQLARAADRFDLYEKYIRLNDERGVSPGVQDLRDFLNGCGSCLILLDELVAYGKKIYKGGNIEGGDFDGFIVFLQELSEAILSSDRSMLVTSLPQSEIEIGFGDGGREVLRTIEHHLGRLQSAWSPVEAQESFEIVRRRLFLPCRQQKLRDEVCSVFSDMYRASRTMFPNETKEVSYRERLKACYPLHPQLFELLYNKWASIETFQRTRGVLRFVAELVHELWEYADEHPIIMTSSIPLSKPNVRNELARYLPSNWPMIIDAEIDGVNSLPYKLEKTEHNIQHQIARRLTRTIFIGSAPTARGQNVRGLTQQEINLGVISPSDRRDKKILDAFVDMIDRLKEKLTYLYANQTHTWFDGRPTLRKVAEALEEQIEDRQVEDEIIDRLNALRYYGSFHERYVTAKKEEVPDLDCVRIVILSPSVCASDRLMGNASAHRAASDILRQQRDGVPRVHKNMLIFLTSEEQGIIALRKLIRSLQAWRQLESEKDLRNLDQVQLAEVNKNIDTFESRVVAQITAIYSRMLIPEVEPGDMRIIKFKEDRLNCSELNNIEVAAQILVRRGALYHDIPPNILHNAVSRFLFDPRGVMHISIGDLWEFLTQYIYAVRLYERSVMLKSLREAVRQGLFGLAESYDERTGKYIDPVINRSVTLDSLDQLVVEGRVVLKQLDMLRELEEKRAAPPPVRRNEYVEPDPTRFSMELEFDEAELSKNFVRSVVEITSILRSLPDAETSVKLTIESQVPDGIPDQERTALSQNAESLHAIARFSL